MTGKCSTVDEGTSASTIPSCSFIAGDTANSRANAVAPDTPGTCVSPAPPDEADDVANDTSQRAALVEPRQMMEVPEPLGDSQ